MRTKCAFAARDLRQLLAIRDRHEKHQDVGKWIFAADASPFGRGRKSTFATTISASYPYTKKPSDIVNGDPLITPDETKRTLPWLGS